MMDLSDQTSVKPTSDHIVSLTTTLTPTQTASQNRGKRKYPEFEVLVPTFRQVLLSSKRASQGSKSHSVSRTTSQILHASLMATLRVL